jgi:small-conductance mechanosensitive channel
MSENPRRAMPSLEELKAALAELVPLLTVLVVSGGVLFVVNRFYRRRPAHGEGVRFAHQITMLLVTAAGLVAAIVALPIEADMRGNLLSLLGLVLTAVIALSSTAFVSNAMAGLMMRAVRAFRTGDFVSVEDQFGRVTERGLFHTEIQTEDRDLVTLPNLWLVTRPVKVMRATGTVVSATLSLGYDIDRTRVERLAVSATADAGLTDGFVQVLELGDFAVTYRVAGFLTEVKQVLTARARLRACTMDRLHGAGIEIASPTLMDQRAVGAEARFAPPPGSVSPGRSDGTEAPENLIFDKADAAERIDELRTKQQELAAEVAELEERKAEGDAEAVEGELRRARRRLEIIEGRLAAAEQASEGED